MSSPYAVPNSNRLEFKRPRAKKPLTLAYSKTKNLTLVPPSRQTFTKGSDEFDEFEIVPFNYQFSADVVCSNCCQRIDEKKGHRNDGSECVVSRYFPVERDWLVAGDNPLRCLNCSNLLVDDSQWHPQDGSKCCHSSEIESEGGFVRDLTKEGIEPNPGPKTEAQRARRRERRKLKRKVQGEAKVLVVPVVKGSGKYTRGSGKGAVILPRSRIAGSGKYEPESKHGKKWSRIGALGGDLISSIMGSGAYHQDMQYNTLMDVGGPPQFSSGKVGKNSVFVSHREYIGEVAGSVGFVNTTYAISPYNPNLFPWLATLAANFECYRIHGLVFELNTEATDYASGANIGSIMMSTEYNANLPSFTSKIGMLNYEFTTSTKTSNNLYHGVECARDETVAPILFTYSTGSPGAVNDLRLSTLGNFQVATQGQASTAVVAELWATFQVELLKPRLGNPIGVSSYSLFDNAPANTDIFSATNVSTIVDTLGVNAGPAANLSVFSANNFQPTGVQFFHPALSGRKARIVYSATSVNAYTGTPLAPVNAGQVGITINQVNVAILPANGTQMMVDVSVTFNGVGPWTFTAGVLPNWGAATTTRFNVALVG